MTLHDKTTRKEWKSSNLSGNGETELRNRPGDSTQDWAMQKVVGKLKEKEKEGATSQQELFQGCQMMLRGHSA